MVTQTIASGLYEGNTSQISSLHFGDIFTTKSISFDEHLAALELGGFNLGHIRWPGGHIPEIGSFRDYTYSLTNENIYDKPGEGLSDIMALAYHPSIF